MDDCAEKIKLFIAHLMRVQNQRQQINGLYDDMEPGECLILIDYKMKFEHVYFREKTVEYFGKKGLSWHGAMIYYICLETKELKILYYDHIFTGDLKQDWLDGSALYGYCNVVKE